MMFAYGPWGFGLPAIALFILWATTANTQMIQFIQSRPPPGQHCCPVNATKFWSKSIHGLDEQSAAILKPLLEYKFYLPRIQLKAGLEYYGAARRLRKFVSRLLDDTRPLKIGVVGGSISWGVGTTGIEARWFTILSKWLGSVAKGDVSSRNGCIPATPSAYMLVCLEESVDEDVDLVFVEYSVNDGVENTLVGNRIVKTMEQLLRRIMELPGRPAVVLVQVPHVWSAEYEPFFHTSEDLEGALSAYYDVPSISLRDALFPLAAFYPTDGFLWNQTYGITHPGDAGHKILADLAVHLIQETARDLQTDPWTAQEEEEVARPLPDPMYPGNLPPHESSCVAAHGFKGLVKSAAGWGWVNEATDDRTRGKWGYVSSKPGSKLQFVVDTRRKGLPPNETVPLLIHYLKSYRGMGIARLNCTSGCTCPSLDIDAGLKAYHSQTVMAAVRVTQHAQCRLQLTVLSNTTTDGYKFKVSGVTIIGNPDYNPDFFTVEFWNNADGATPPASSLPAGPSLPPPQQQQQQQQSGDVSAGEGAQQPRSTAVDSAARRRRRR